MKSKKGQNNALACTDMFYPSGFMNVLQVEKTKENFCLLYHTKSRFTMHQIIKNENSEWYEQNKATTHGYAHAETKVTVQDDIFDLDMAILQPLDGKLERFVTKLY